jgi:MoaA/NifB/PqqE/SkfB family radical SAM enzyme
MGLWPFLRQLWRKPSRRSVAWQLELTTRCPLRCRMCIRQGLDNWQGQDMDFDHFRSLSPYFRHVDHVVLEGWGEPLVYPQLLDAVQLVKGHGARAGFVTSGYGLTRDYSAELIRAGLDFIGFSLAGATASTHEAIRIHSSHDQILQAIQDIVAIKHDGKLSIPQVHIVYLMLRDNFHEIPLLLETAHRIGITDVLLLHLIHVTTPWQDQQKMFQCEQHEDAAILREADVRAESLGIRLRRAAVTPQLTAVCAENPLDNLYISVSGEVSPCVYLYPPTTSPFHRIFCGTHHTLARLSFGNIFETPFEDIWNRPDYIEFRRLFREREKPLNPQPGPIPMSFTADDTYRKRLAKANFPSPPGPCRTCHKILGV